MIFCSLSSADTRSTLGLPRHSPSPRSLISHNCSTNSLWFLKVLTPFHHRSPPVTFQKIQNRSTLKKPHKFYILFTLGKQLLTMKKGKIKYLKCFPSSNCCTNQLCSRWSVQICSHLTQDKLQAMENALNYLNKGTILSQVAMMAQQRGQLVLTTLRSFIFRFSLVYNPYCSQVLGKILLTAGQFAHEVSSGFTETPSIHSSVGWWKTKSNTHRNCRKLCSEAEKLCPSPEFCWFLSFPKILITQHVNRKYMEKKKR